MLGEFRPPPLQFKYIHKYIYNVYSYLVIKTINFACSESKTKLSAVYDNILLKSIQPR